MIKTIAVLPGDGVGPEIIDATLSVLRAVERKFDHSFTCDRGLIGGVAIDSVGEPFPKETEELCMKSDAILFGAIGDPKYDNDPSLKVRPEQGLLKMRKKLGLYANIRPIRTFDSLLHKSPLKEERVEGADFIVIRELIGGIYFGKRGRENGGRTAFDTSSYSIEEIQRVGNVAFELSQKRNKKVCLVDKANVLETSRLWRETIQELSKNYPDVEVEYMFVDNAAMQIIKNPRAFDVILTENMFGDILSDEASVITGSIGMLPSASIGEKTSLYEPIHGSYPKAAGKNIANPIGTILSVAMMLELSFKMLPEAQVIRDAVDTVLSSGLGTRDISLIKPLSTSAMGEKIAENI
ncbi:3-isopropylmalate dehydrogenase [Candidatus Roizmanbacteria bacterium CG11_big_fil_rev_8_21_14_0_20_36_8]|uniref:3-isopropylmalate dehydrogenase n=2 Tax=Candidatus Roizmaniibacteriota TaxID=1752723 RepID=A0A2M8F4E2_9BACT|nr:MAG: 3-isopropylmalate dehydrogenase [Candidatus Roizmanbacteria bacterium CG11_big_fil_rev_8_21_14_0_20_36_8]PIZ66696.1 MAG: 3-isopropylmalate dehydrogenase [Candidatus Roizmanbacteria bacterium CG_4_10_14_0_2_um_filter_39_12]PJC34155.1 MAG: 3-isopropylmalate dehydrogenase [Candidatus Roizmanbacteria bacterium CG_4_9_14_0_2_um_filter_39_13]